MPGASSGFLDFEERAAERAQQAQRAQYMQMLMAQQAMAQQNQQRQLAARQAISRGLPTLLGPGAGGAIPIPGQPVAPPGGGMPIPGPVAAPAPAPAPGSLSPGGGNPQAQAPAPQPAPQPQAAPAGPPMPPVIPPFRPMPTSPAGGGAPGGGQIAMPAGPPAPDPLAAPKPMPSVADIVARMDKAGISPEQRLDALDQLEPILAANQKAELDHFKMVAGAQSAALRAATAFITANASQTRAETGVRAEERRTDQGNVRADQRQQEIDIKKQKEDRLRSGAARGTSTTGPLKGVEIVYDKPGGEPVGTRGTTKTGKLVYLDMEGRQTAGLAGVTAKEGKTQSVKVTDTIRGNLVAGSSANALRLLDEAESSNLNTSAKFGTHADTIVGKVAAGAVNTMLTPAQRQQDARWAGIIEEVGPVLSGGLRNSDAFRRYLIEQAPGIGDDAETRKTKMKILRDNVSGVSNAFKQKFANDRKMWGEGVTKAQVDAMLAGRGAAAPGAPAVGAVEQGYRFKGGDPAGRSNWEKVNPIATPGVRG